MRMHTQGCVRMFAQAYVRMYTRGCVRMYAQACVRMNHKHLLTGQLLTKEMKRRTVAHPVLMLFDIQKTNK